MKILLADDHDVVRRGLKQILADGFPHVQFGEAANAKEIMAAVAKTAWDIVILDINLPGKSGLEVLKELHKSRPELPILVVSVHAENQYAIPVIKIGAAGYLSKDCPGEDLVKACKRILDGGKYVSPDIAERLASSLNPRTQKQAHETLSTREFQVFRMISSGKTTSQIAVDLDLSIQTISTYRSRILKKLKMENNAEMMRYAMKMGLV